MAKEKVRGGNGKVTFGLLAILVFGICLGAYENELLYESGKIIKNSALVGKIRGILEQVKQRKLEDEGEEEEEEEGRIWEGKEVEEAMEEFLQINVKEQKKKKTENNWNKSSAAYKNVKIIEKMKDRDFKKRLLDTAVEIRALKGFEQGFEKATEVMVGDRIYVKEGERFNLIGKGKEETGIDKDWIRKMIIEGDELESKEEKRKERIIREMYKRHLERVEKEEKYKNTEREDTEKIKAIIEASQNSRLIENILGGNRQGRNSEKTRDYLGWEEAIKTAEGVMGYPIKLYDGWKHKKNEKTKVKENTSWKKKITEIENEIKKSREKMKREIERIIQGGREKDKKITEEFFTEVDSKLKSYRSQDDGEERNGLEELTKKIGGNYDVEIFWDDKIGTGIGGKKGKDILVESLVNVTLEKAKKMRRAVDNIYKKIKRNYQTQQKMTAKAIRRYGDERRERKQFEGSYKKLLEGIRKIELMLVGEKYQEDGSVYDTAKQAKDRTDIRTIFAEALLITIFGESDRYEPNQEEIKKPERFELYKKKIPEEVKTKDRMEKKMKSIFEALGKLIEEKKDRKQKGKETTFGEETFQIEQYKERFKDAGKGGFFTKEQNKTKLIGTPEEKRNLSFQATRVVQSMTTSEDKREIALEGKYGTSKQGGKQILLIKRSKIEKEKKITKQDDETKYEVVIYERENEKMKEFIGTTNFSSKRGRREGRNEFRQKNFKTKNMEIPGNKEGTGKKYGDETKNIKEQERTESEVIKKDYKKIMSESLYLETEEKGENGLRALVIQRENKKIDIKEGKCKVVTKEKWETTTGDLSFAIVCIKNGKIEIQKHYDA